MRAPIDGGELDYTITGEGSPLLLLRPLGGSMRLWGAFADTLAAHHRVIAFDPRGVGRSSEPPLLVTTEGMARDALGLLDHLGVERAALFGLSLGGMVASWVAIDAPARVSRLVLASCLPRVGDLSKRGVQALVHMSGSLWRAGVRAELSMVHRILSPRFRVAHPHRMHEIDDAVRAAPTSRSHLAALALAAARHDPGARWRDIASPTLVLAGELDPLIGETARDDLVQHIPHATLEIIAGCGHDLTLEKPRETADRVLAFLARGSEACG